MTIVAELQREALDEKTSVTALLRKALIVAHKLEQNEFATWIESELNGYPTGEGKTPAYREIRGATRVFNPYRGWIPLDFPSAELVKRFTRMSFHLPISQIEAAAERDEVAFGYQPEVELHLMRAMTGPPLTPSLHFDGSQFRAIVETVRTAVLKWAIELEKKGIHGSGVSFSSQEREKATSNSTTFNIETYIGSMQHSQIQRDVQSSVQTLTTNELDLEAVAKLIERIDSLVKREAPGELLLELQSDLASIKAQLASPKPKHPVIREGLRSLRSVLEQAGGNLAASGITGALTTLIGP